MEDFKGTRTKKGELKWIRSGMGFQVLTADFYYSICEAVGKRGQEEQVANAQLISCAPELLALHQKFLEMFAEYDMRPEDELHEYANEVMDVIAKALGKEAEDEQR